MPFLGKQPATGEFKKLDTIVPDGSTSYTLQYDSVDFQPGQAEKLMVSVNGVIQAPGNAFTVNGATITFTEAVTSNDTIDFIIAMGEVGNTTVVSDGSVTPNKLADSLVLDDTPIRVNANVIDTNVTIASDKNAFVAGPVQIDSTIVIDGTLTVI
jgi:hypothetical protein